MYTHIRRKHGGSQPESAPKVGRSRAASGDGVQPPSSMNHGEATEPSNYMHEVPYRLNTTASEVKKTETILDHFLENIHRINEASRLLNESRQNSSADSSFNEIGKLLMVRMACNSFQGKHSMPIKKEIPPSGYQISTFCDTCLSGCNVRPVFYPIEFEGITKLNHKCVPKNSFVGKTEDEILGMKRQHQIWSVDFLSKVVSSRIGHRDAYLKLLKLSQNAFSKEIQSKWKLPANQSIIEEKDCIEINPSCDGEHMNHWFCRAIKEYDKNSNIKINRKELAEFLRIAKSTFGVFRFGMSDPVKKNYLLMYLVI